MANVETPAPASGAGTRAKAGASKKARATPAGKATAAPVSPGPAAPQALPADRPKHKLVRDSFAIPKAEYATLEALKLRAATLARPAKKSEVLRAGIAALARMNDRAFLAALGSIPSLKTGRPKQA